VLLASPPRAARRRVPPRWRALAPCLALAAAACGRDVTVTVRTGDRPPDPDAVAPAPAVARRVLSAGVAIDTFQIVFRDLRLQPEPREDGSPTANDARVGPANIVVDLSGAQLDPGAMTEVVPSELVRWASFYQTTIDLRPVSQEDVAADAALAPLLGKTFVVTGRLPGGATFTYSSSVTTTLVRPATFRMGLNHNNVTINVAVNRWFEGPNGEPLDPRDPAAAATIEANILASIDGYMDDNRDGNPDSLG
jgi:hypothetical protein